MKQKIWDATAFCLNVVGETKNQCILCSFGKDSMVMLHLMRSVGLNLPIVSFRDPWFPKKHAFANRVIEDWNLKVWSYGPLATSIMYGKEKTVLVGSHDAAGATIDMPHGIVESETGICARDDFFGQPLTRFNFIWNVGFVGHRSADVDAIYGKVPLKTKFLKREVGPSFAFPLKDWRDEDVWRYIEENKVPLDAGRYDVANRREWPDKSINSDYLSICVKCVHKRDFGNHVLCPKTGTMIENISDKVPVYSKTWDYFEAEHKAEG